MKSTHSRGSYRLIYATNLSVFCHHEPSNLGNLREKSFKITQWPKGFFVQPAKTGTVTWEQLVAMFFH